MNSNGNGVYTGGDGWVNDIWHGTDAVERVYGKNGDDVLYAHGGDDEVFGDGDSIGEHSATYGNWHRGNDFLDGGNGNDFMVGGNDGDELYGGTGDDTLIGDFTQAFAHRFAAPPELIHYFPSTDHLYGGAGSDHLYGNESDDFLYGEDGNDSLEGGVGNDYLDGGPDNDMLIAGDGDDDVHGGSGWDTLTGGLGNDKLYGMTGSDQIYGELGDDVLVGGSAGDTFNDDFYAGDGNDRLFGADGNDRMFGDAGNDELDGGRGADYMEGGTGDDVYVVDSAADRIVEAAEGGIDHVKARTSIFLAANVENLSIEASAGAIDAGGNALNNRITGNGYANTLMGQDGDDQLFGMGGNDVLDGGTGLNYVAGGFGDDTYLVDDNGDTLTEEAGQGIDTVRSTMHYMMGANVENLTLEGINPINATGNALDNVLRGNIAANLLQGGAGADAMSGGLGDDTYVVDQAGDVVTELAAQGNDTVESLISYRLSDNVESLKLSGSGAMNGYGNELSNQITGNSGANDLAGEGGDDQLLGGDGNDQLNGGGGADVMHGGAGDDNYIVDNAGDLIVEALAGGIDHVTAHVGTALAANVENLLLAATAGAINGTGNDLSNQITGNNHANILDGGKGADILAGMAGDDLYVIDDAGDSVNELANAGFDTVESSIHYTLGASLEALRLSGSADLNGTGNELDNALTGNAGKNTLIGGGGVDTLVGAAGNDTLDGGAEADTLRGGSGNDSYVVDNALDIIEENMNEGTDSMQSGASYTLSANVERLTLTGAAAISATGNALNNTLTGNNAQNVLVGGGGNDTLGGGGGADILLGGDGNDIFIFDAIDLTIAGTRYDGGTGSDTLRVGGSGKLLDLTALSDERMIGIETIDLIGSGNNKLVLAHVDVLALSDIDALTVAGNAGDTVTLVGSGWSAGTDLSIGSELYHSYLNADATLLVDADVQAAFVSGQA